MTMQKRMTYILLSIVVAVIAIFAAYTYITLHMSYSDGVRAGLLQKFSRKGWICKTWEGEILLTSMPGAIPERFDFSVRDDAVARQLISATGKRVTLTYSQHKGVPTACFAETEYYVEKVEIQP
jgi:hypothetical protein